MAYHKRPTLKWCATVFERRKLHDASSTPVWRSSIALDDWVKRDARPISLRQLTFFGRSLTKDRLFDSANYVRTELPIRIAHRLRDMQTLPYIVVANSHLSHVYDLYYRAFESFRKIPHISSVEENERFCDVVRGTLTEHLTVIPRLVMGAIEVQGYMRREELDSFITSMLRSRISRRVIAEQHIALTETHDGSRKHYDASMSDDIDDSNFVGEIFLRCNAKEVVEKCAAVTRELMQKTYGEDCKMPEIKLQGHVDAKFPYILSHLEYVVGELLRNSIQATIEHGVGQKSVPPPIDVLICETSQHVIMRISDRGGGIPLDLLPHIWSFSKTHRRNDRLKNLNKVPRMSATLQELRSGRIDIDGKEKSRDSSLSSLASRPPELKLGMGLPMSKIYAEYWAGSLQLHSLEGYGVDTFLQISKLGNKNEHITTRASIDAV